VDKRGQAETKRRRTAEDRQGQDWKDGDRNNPERTSWRQAGDRRGQAGPVRTGACPGQEETEEDEHKGQRVSNPPWKFPESPARSTWARRRGYRS
jgi:hypothetical protein